LISAPTSSSPKHDGRGLVIQGPSEKMRMAGEGPRDKAAAHACIAGRQEFLIDPLRIAVANPDDAEAARFGDRLCQRSTGRSSHGGKKDGMADAELLRELCAKRHRDCSF